MPKIYDYNFENNYFIYSHTRPDTNQIFYIGIGKKKKNRNPYYRAYSNKNRNKYWKNIVNKNNNTYEVNIIFECNSIEDLKNKEIEYINIYKRFLDGGTLCNITLGGEGLNGYKHTEESKRLIGLKGIGRKKTQEQIENVSKAREIPIIQLDLDGKFIKEWDSIKKTAIGLKMKSSSQIRKILEEKKGSSKGFFFVFKKDYDSTKAYNPIFSNSKRLLQLNLNNSLVKEWKSAKEAADTLGFNYSSIRECCSFYRGTNIYKNFIWKNKY